MNIEQDMIVDNKKHFQWLDRWEHSMNFVKGPAKQEFLQRLFALTESSSLGEAAKEFLFYPQADEKALYSFAPVRGMDSGLAQQLGAAYRNVLEQKISPSTPYAFGVNEEMIMGRYCCTMRYSAELTDKVIAQSKMIAGLANVMPIADGIEADHWNEMDGMIKGEYLVRLSDATDYALDRTGVVTKNEAAEAMPSELKMLRLIEATETLSHKDAIYFLQHEKARELIESEAMKAAQDDADHNDYALFKLEKDICKMFAENAETGDYLISMAGPTEYLARSAELFRPADEMVPEKRETQLLNVLNAMRDAPAAFGDMNAAINHAAVKADEYRKNYQPKPILG